MKKNKKNMDRRTFLKTTGVGTASIALSTGISGDLMASTGAKEDANTEMPTRMLGKSGIPVPILSLGGSQDLTTNQHVLKIGFDMGVNFWDTGDTYANGKSEIGIGQYFDKYPEDRKKVFICTKVLEKYTPQEVSDAIDSSLEKMRTDYLDLFLFHNISTVENLTPEIMKLAEQKKKEGKIKLFGISTHLFSGDQFLSEVATMDWIDAIMLTYNYVVMQRDEIQKGMDACAKAGIGVIAIKTQAKNMNIVETPQMLEALNHFLEKGYTLEQAKLKAVWNDERVSTICSHITNLTILKDNVTAATDNVILSSQDFGILNMLADSERSHYCQGCGACISAMGPGDRVPDIMRYMMYYNSYGERDRARDLFRSLPETLRNSLASKDYSPAEAACPHKIQIGKVMKKASVLLA
jgi:predicted aldo/keto reductase-like oxidoreductase